MWFKKKQSFYDNLKQKEGSKSGEFNASKEWFANFRKSFGLKNVKITEEAASTNQKAAEFPDVMRQTIEEKRDLPEQFFDADENALL